MQLGALSSLGHVISHVMMSSGEERMDISDQLAVSIDLVHSALSVLCEYTVLSTLCNVECY